MQQAIYTNINKTAQTNAKMPPARKTTLRRHLALKWDLYGVALLMASSAAYGVFALASVV